MRRLCFSVLVLSYAAAASLIADERESQLQILQPGLALKLIAQHPELATPTGIDVDSLGRIWVVATHTHFRPDDYVGPEHDEVLIFSNLDEDAQAQRQVFYNETDATMDLELGPDGWVYLAERDRILRIRDDDADGAAEVAQDLIILNTEADYPHNGLEALAWHPDGDLVFGLGENYAKPWTMTGTDGRKIAGTGEGGIFRCSANGSQLRRIARGLWNPFGICVRPDGQMFAADNDPGERPPCRLLHIVAGGDYGYQRDYGSEAHHPFVTWNGGLRGTLPMIHPTGEAPCGVTPLGRGLIVPSWSDHRIDWFQLRPKGASYSANRMALITGGRYFRPGCIAPDPNSTAMKRAWYLTDWVDGRYQAHGFGRIWKLEVDMAVANWVGELDSEPPTANAILANGLQTESTRYSLKTLMRESRNADAFVARSALIALATRAADWVPQEVARSAAEDRVSAVLALKLATVPAQGWIGPLLADRNGDVQFETLRWIADARLTEFLPNVEQYLARIDLDYRRFEAAVATRNALMGQPESGIRDTDLLLSKVRDNSSPPSLRAHALRLLPTPALAAQNDNKETRHEFPKGLTLDLLKELLASNDETLSLEVVRTLSLNPALSHPILTEIAADRQKSETLRAEAVAGLAPVAGNHVDMLIELTDAERAVREEALRCLRSVKLTDDHRGRLKTFALDHAESADAFEATQYPTSIAAGRPPVTDTNAWLQAIIGVTSPVNLANGRRIFHQSSLVRCSNCHRHRGRGNIVGPDLSNVSRGQDRKELLQAILEPSLKMAPEYQPRTILLKDGRTATGIRLRSWTSEVLRDANGQNQSFTRDAIESMVESTTSFMPAGLASLLTLRELRDLLAFLQETADVP